MRRPTISLAMIVKNERHNLPRLLESVSGCFDEIVITDTGSTDGTVDYLSSDEPATIAKCPVRLKHFAWVNDFAAARNFSFEGVTSDFVYWQDGDDILHNREAFIKWRDTAMAFADCWLASYEYAVDPKTLEPLISFARERAFRVAKKPLWRYFVHEGVIPGPDWSTNYITTWTVKHLRSEADQNADRSRNIKLFEGRKDTLDGRMHYYYGKELFENRMYDRALSVLSEAVTRPDLEIHDRTLGFQYAAYSAMYLADQMKPEFAAEKLTVAINLAHSGLQLDPKRAEFHCIIGECYQKQGRLAEALPSFAAAEHCMAQAAGSPYAGAIFNFKGLYGEVPKIQKAKIYYHLGRLEEAEREAREAHAKFHSPEALAMIQELERIKPLITVDGPKLKTTDIVFTCPPQTAYPFDEELYKTKPLGGSETALVQVAKALKKKTGRRVIVFNMRDADLVAESGVEYFSTSKLNEYFAANEPAVAISWRHNIKVTNAPKYLWCHDLVTPSVEAVHNFEKILCLTPWHGRYVEALQGVPSEKVLVTRNGVDPAKFDFPKPAKNPNKCVWMSSPDRGLDRCMHVLDEVRKTHPEVTLDVYYGLENLRKYGMHELAQKLEGMMAARPWVKYHGFTEQSKMYREVADAVIWPHSCNFIETSCITAMEMLVLGVFPVTRRLGGLADTLADAETKGQAVMLDHDAVTPEEIEAYAREIRAAIDEKKWERVSLDPQTLSWEGVADQWVKEMGL